MLSVDNAQLGPQLSRPGRPTSRVSSRWGVGGMSPSLGPPRFPRFGSGCSRGSPANILCVVGVEQSELAPLAVGAGNPISKQPATLQAHLIAWCWSSCQSAPPKAAEGANRGVVPIALVCLPCNLSPSTDAWKNLAVAACLIHRDGVRLAVETNKSGRAFRRMISRAGERLHLSYSRRG